MQIGNIKLKNNLILAPLAGYTDKAFRQICREYGASIAVTEMVSAEGLARDGEKTKELLERFDNEDDLIIQIFTPTLSPVERCLDKLLKYNPTIIDLNCGCPVNKVVKTGAGSALMKDIDRMHEIVSFLKRNTDTPISVKFRLGWDSSSINYLEFASSAVDAGAAMLTLHARTRSQGYNGSASYQDIKGLKEHFKTKDVTIFGSGDVFSPECAKRMLDETGVDGVMFARGAIGNPFIFKQTLSLLESGSYCEVTVDEKVECIKKHLSYMIKYLGPELACKEMRKHVCSYIKGIPNANRVKAEIVCAKSEDDYLRVLEKLG